MALREPATWLVVPTYNEAENIEGFVAAVLAVLPGERRVLIVDDDSPDGTGVIADRLAAEHEEVQVLHRPRKEGLGPAYIAGFGVALAGGAERVVSMDADFSHDPADLPRLIAATGGGGADGADDGGLGGGGPARTGADLAIGSRYVPGGGVAEWGPLRRLVSRGGSTYARAVLGLGVRDLTGGFKCYRREVLEAIDLPGIASRGYAFQVETTYRAARAGFGIVEVPITFTDRRVGSSKMSRAIFAEAVWRVPAMRVGAARRARRTGGRPNR